jgi:hypothetical protein
MTGRYTKKLSENAGRAYPDEAYLGNIVGSGSGAVASSSDISGKAILRQM